MQKFLSENVRTAERPPPLPQGYANQPGYETFRDLLEAPMAAAKAALADRCPAPRLVESDVGGSQARFVLAKLNPSHTHNSGQYGDGGEVIFTDDVPLSVFVEHLSKLAVTGT